jgi:type VI secretion system protein ImpH
MRLPRGFLCHLGESAETGSLGVSATVGERAWDVQGRFRVVLGPVDYATFQRFLPGGASLERVNALVRSFVDREFEWDVQVVLLQDEVPGVRLGESGWLGWTSWLLAETATGDADDYVIVPELVSPLARARSGNAASDRS